LFEPPQYVLLNVGNDVPGYTVKDPEYHYMNVRHHENLKFLVLNFRHVGIVKNGRSVTIVIFGTIVS
jgi:hypothetical protein